MKLTLCKEFLFSILLLCASATFAQKEVPELWGERVHDDAEVLSHKTLNALEKRLTAYERETSNQIAVLIVDSLNGEALEDYSLRVAEKWKLGRKNNDNGVLLLVAVDDRKIRIEVGQGLEGTLTDALCSRIIRNEIVPNFRRGNYSDGVISGIESIIKAIGGEYTGDGSISGADTNNFFKRLYSNSEQILLGVVVFGILGLLTIVSLAVKGGRGWFIYFLLIIFYATFPLAIIGLHGGLVLLALYVVGMPILRIILARIPWWRRRMIEGSSGGGGSSFSSSSHSGSRSNGGGFSGGGGSFGGGGSSGSW